MEFMSSDINGFMDALAGYKATITVGLGTITMQNSKINSQVLEEYNEMIKDTAYNLTIHLQRIDARLEELTASGNDSLNTSINLQDEKDVTHQCLRICESAKTYLESLQNEQPSMLRQETSLPENFGRSQFEAQVLTQKVFAENRGKLIETIGCLQERLLAIISSTGPERNRERLQLQEDLDVSRQCLEVCDQASRQVSNQKIHTIGEVVADDDTDQVVVTTLADLFDVRKVLAKNRSAQLVGSMTDDALIKLSGDRYGSRFGALNGNLGRVHVDVATYESNAGHPSRMKMERPPMDAGQRTESPVPNEMRKRSSGFDNRR
ncbi:hypothetical protein PFICI_11047 [Pestalotiopsis fici W106-1]|uniref:Azaphilone pigments biosynthesis cluster protein L N-terminal domain-containing protein n=1 Tax=Pestalotiopsis fici (strain W106-1 / CGMCC3.15140) TaxID=1229662 RepID=W3WTI8_PESFW|nr:uncharacterized protein PFICI_11047 [Pestalotiopsis fici W106-1]ETS77173.1 hypothetical protein PFICI_11047 [Pestalotiopsis fici W106-1]